MRATPLDTDPIIAIATAPGRGAVGIVRISGRRLLPWAQALCGRALQARQASYLPLREADGSTLDHVLALFFAAPHSYTGEDVLELQAHGGPVVLQLLVQRCLQLAASPDPGSGQPLLAGLRLAQPGEFSQRAFLNDKIDLAQAEAIADLIDASTEAAARSASRSLAGEFSRDIDALRQALIHLRMLVEATLDFPEEEIDFLQQADAHGQLLGLQQRLSQVLQRTRQGALLREGIRVVIAGQPNAGKSSLLNALAGAELAIVTPLAGTTRDVVQQTIQIEGVPLHVIDTAGLRQGAEVDTVEHIGIERAWGQIEQADAVLFLHDLTQAQHPAWAQADANIAHALAQRVSAAVPIINVWNKADALPDPDQANTLVNTLANTLTSSAANTPASAAPLPTQAPQALVLSAKTGHGLQHLRQRLLQVAGWQQHSEGLYIARQRHVQALQRVAQHLQTALHHLQQQAQHLDLLAEELRLGQNALGEITGEFSADDLLGVIFSKFCIGK